MRKPPPRRLLAIDPGGTTGWAYFEDGKLVACGKWKIEKMFQEWIVDPKGLVVVVESQKIYPGNKKKKNIPDNDIVELARRAGELAGFYRAGGAIREYVMPRDWKGTIPKPEPGKRYIVEKRVLAVSDEDESMLIYSTKSARAKTLDHNMIDAIGIGYWKLGRKYRGEAK